MTRLEYKKSPLAIIMHSIFFNTCISMIICVRECSKQLSIICLKVSNLMSIICLKLSKLLNIICLRMRYLLQLMQHQRHMHDLPAGLLGIWHGHLHSCPCHFSTFSFFVFFNLKTYVYAALLDLLQYRYRYSSGMNCKLY